MFEKSTHHYTDSGGGVLRSPAYLVVYLILVVGIAYLSVRLPSSFLPDENKGIFMTMVSCQE
ncbi:efflux RND transporter permease subunit [Escherichia coli]